MAKRGSNDFINLTLTEFLMVIVFMLLSLLLYSFAKQKILIANDMLTTQEMAQVEGNATMFSEVLFHEDPPPADGKDAIFKFIEQMNGALKNETAQKVSRDTPLPELWDTLVAKEHEVKSLTKTIQELTEAAKNNDDWDEIQLLVNKAITLEKKLNSAQKELSEFRTLAKNTFSVLSPNELKKNIHTLKGRYENLLKRAEKNGFGNPLCWADPKGKIEYLFLIEVLENGMFHVLNIMPKYREKELKKIGYKHTQKSRVLDYNEFKNQMNVFWDYGQRNESCRFFVKVKDKTKTKKRWKEGLSLIENFFYKNVVR